MVSESSSHEQGNYITGTHISYYFICKTKLWLFSHNLSLETESPLVQIGKEVHRTTYPREKRTEITRKVAPDYAKKRDVLYIHDIKKSSKMRRAHRAQMLFYLCNLKRRGVLAVGVINYPMERRREFVELTENREEELREALADIERIVLQPSPPRPSRTRICPKCAYCEFCWGDVYEK